LNGKEGQPYRVLFADFPSTPSSLLLLHYCLKGDNRIPYLLLIFSPIPRQSTSPL